MFMNKIFTKTQLKHINSFLDNQLKMVDKEIVLNQKSKKKTKKFILDYSKSLSTDQKKTNLFILN